MEFSGNRVVKGEYSFEEDPPVPVVSIKVYSPTKRKCINVKAKIDTGFSGSLLLSLENYLKLGLHLYESRKVHGVFAGGYGVELRKSRGFVELNNTLMLCDIYTTILAKKNILGRAILNKFKLVLWPRNNIVEIHLV